MDSKDNNYLWDINLQKKKDPNFFIVHRPAAVRRGEKMSTLGGKAPPADKFSWDFAPAKTEIDQQQMVLEPSKLGLKYNKNVELYMIYMIYISIPETKIWFILPTSL